MIKINVIALFYLSTFSCLATNDVMPPMSLEQRFLFEIGMSDPPIHVSSLQDSIGVANNTVCGSVSLSSQEDRDFNL